MFPYISLSPQTFPSVAIDLSQVAVWNNLDFWWAHQNVAKMWFKIEELDYKGGKTIKRKYIKWYKSTFFKQTGLIFLRGRRGGICY